MFIGKDGRDTVDNRVGPATEGRDLAELIESDCERRLGAGSW